MTHTPKITAAIFDKDGTLFDFRASWGAWTKALLADLGGDQARLAQILGFDPTTGDFDPASVVIACTTAQIADAVMPGVPHLTRDEVYARMNRLAAEAPMVPAVDLAQVLGDLKAQGLTLGLATNDTEAPARRHLQTAGVADLFSFVAGADSGFGGKPAPGQLLAFAKACDLDPKTVVMVGDSRHDLDAGRAAGMKAVAVLTGIATAADLAPHADAVLPDIGALSGWIAAQG